VHHNFPEADAGRSSGTTANLLGPGLSPAQLTTTPHASVHTPPAARRLATPRCGPRSPSFPMMTAVRYTCGKIGLVSGTGVAGGTTRAIPATAGVHGGVRTAHG
jgi:hypothetical protein